MDVLVAALAQMLVKTSQTTPPVTFRSRCQVVGSENREGPCPPYSQPVQEGDMEKLEHLMNPEVLAAVSDKHKLFYKLASAIKLG